MSCINKLYYFKLFVSIFILEYLNSIFISIWPIEFKQWTWIFKQSKFARILTVWINRDEAAVEAL